MGTTIRQQYFLEPVGLAERVGIDSIGSGINGDSGSMTWSGGASWTIQAANVRKVL